MMLLIGLCLGFALGVLVMRARVDMARDAVEDANARAVRVADIVFTRIAAGRERRQG